MKNATNEEIFTSGQIPTESQTTPPTKVATNPHEQQSIGTNYVLNTNTQKFHYPSCNSTKKIAAHNRSEYTGTRDDVIGRGYSPCGNCHP